MASAVTRVGVGVQAVQASHATDDVDKVNGRPRERHAEAAETIARLLCLQTQFLQLLLMLCSRQKESLRNEKLNESQKKGHSTCERQSVGKYCIQTDRIVQLDSKSIPRACWLQAINSVTHTLP